MKFSIYKESDNSEILINDALDKEICDALNLEYNHVNEIGDLEYGHYYFVECKKDPTIFGGQSSISWVAFLNSIVDYSYIKSGKATEYDLKSALAWCMDHSVEFPWSSKLLLEHFLKFIKSKNYYIKVCGHSSKQFYMSGYVNSYDKSRIIENRTGLFLLDDNGCLKNLYPHIGIFNIIRVNNLTLSNKEIMIDVLDIPSQINAIDINCMLKLGLNIVGIRNLIISRRTVIVEIQKHKDYYEDICSEKLFNTLSFSIDKRDIEVLLDNAKEILSKMWRINIMEIRLK